MSFFPRRITLSALAALALVAVTTQQADAHGKLLSPEARIRPGIGIVEGQQYDFVGEIKGKDVFPPERGQSWSSTPQKNQQLFQTTFTAKGFTTLRQFFQAVDKNMKPRFPGKTDNTCGFTGAAAASDATVTLPADGVIEWGNKAGRWGFQNDHHGPCELWCDDTLVLQNADCRGTFGKELPARMKIDVAQCAGAKRLQFLWLAVHFSNWQYWLNCVPLAPTPGAGAGAMPTVPAVAGANATGAVVAPPLPATAAVVTAAPLAVPGVVPTAVPAVVPAAASAAIPTAVPTAAIPVVVPSAVPATTAAVPAPVPAPVAVPTATMVASKPFDAIKQQDAPGSVVAAPVTGGATGSELPPPSAAASASAAAAANKKLYAQYA